MKKAFPFLFLFSLMLSGCDLDKDDSSKIMYISNLIVDGHEFKPTKYEVDQPAAPLISTTFEEGMDNGEKNVRTFNLGKRYDGVNSSEKIWIRIAYPSSKDKITGTYTFVPTDDNCNGNYRIATAYFPFISGSVTVTDMGNQNFHLKFNNVIAEDPYDGLRKTVKGYFMGTFLYWL